MKNDKVEGYRLIGLDSLIKVRWMIRRAIHWGRRWI